METKIQFTQQLKGQKHVFWSMNYTVTDRIFTVDIVFVVTLKTRQ